MSVGNHVAQLHCHFRPPPPPRGCSPAHRHSEQSAQPQARQLQSQPLGLPGDTVIPGPDPALPSLLDGGQAGAGAPGLPPLGVS